MLPPNTEPSGLSNDTHGKLDRANEDRRLPALLTQPQPEPLALPTIGWHGAGPMKPEILTAGPDPLSLWHAARRRWASALGLGLGLGLIAALLTLWLMPVNVPVAALLQIRRHAPQILDDRTQHIDANEYDSYRRTQQALIKSEFVLHAALRARGIAKLPIMMHESDPIRFLKEEIVVSSPADSELMQIRMTGDRAYQDQMVRIVNAVTDAYLSEYVEKDKDDRLRRRDRLEEQLNRRKDALGSQQKQFFQLAANLGTSDDDNTKVKEMLLLQQINDLRSERSNLQRAAFEAAKEYQAVKLEADRAENSPDEVSQLDVENLLNRDPEYQRKREQVNQLESAILKESSVSKNPNNHTLRQFRAQLDAAQQELDMRKEELLPNILIELGKDKRVAKALKQAEGAVALYDKRIAEVTAMLEQHEKEAKSLTTQDASLDLRREEIKSLQDLIRTMSMQLETMDVEGTEKKRIVLLDRAREPEAADMLMNYLLVCFAGVGGFGVGVVGVAYREFRVRRVRTTAQVTEGLGMRVVGSVPLISGRKAARKAAKSGGNLQGLISESMDSIRTALVHSNGKAAPRMVMITSATQREGKTTVASQLATSVARSGRRTLLVDADLRQPVANQLFELPLNPGMCEVLRGEVELDDCIRPTRAPGLWMLSAGQCDMNALHELARDTLEELFEKLRGEFDFIIVDAGPVLHIADSLLIGQQTDAAILSVLKDSSSLTDVYEASEQLESVGIKVIGIVVNGINAAKKHRAYTLPLKASA